MRSRFLQGAGLLFCFVALAVAPAGARVEIKPGFNTFSLDQDVQLGQQYSKEVEKEVRLVSDAQLSEYVNRLGINLSRYAPGHPFPYRFRVVNAEQINAFALPGGPIYIHTGVITAAATEAQLAGVLAHEISHVALRHSTNQASKAMLAQAPLAILGGILSGGGLGAQMAQIGIGFGVNSAFLKFSRDAERQADQLGAQILYDAGYDPRAMAQFFETIEAESGNRAVEFLSSHPNPGNRQSDILDLIPSLGPAKSFTSRNSEFERIKSRAAGLAESRDDTAGRGQNGVAQRPEPSPPSARLRYFNTDIFSIGYPDNWQVYGEGTSTLTIVPPEGVVRGGPDSLPAIAYGALISLYEPSGRRGRRPSLSEATDQLVRELQRSNPNLRLVSGSRVTRRLDGQQVQFLTALGQSPIPGETEINRIVTALRPEGLWYAVFIAPEREWNSYQDAFQRMLDTVRFPR